MLLARADNHLAAPISGKPFEQFCYIPPCSAVIMDGIKQCGVLLVCKGWFEGGAESAISREQVDRRCLSSCHLPNMTTWQGRAIAPASTQ